jgi:hypothetical protein
MAYFRILAACCLSLTENALAQSATIGKQCGIRFTPNALAGRLRRVRLAA